MAKEIILQQITEDEGWDIYRNYKRVEEDNSLYKWSFVTFTLRNIWGQSRQKFQYAINRENKVVRQLTMGEAFWSGSIKEGD